MFASQFLSEVIIKQHWSYFEFRLDDIIDQLLYVLITITHIGWNQFFMFCELYMFFSKVEKVYDILHWLMREERSYSLEISLVNEQLLQEHLDFINGPSHFILHLFFLKCIFDCLSLKGSFNHGSSVYVVSRFRLIDLVDLIPEWIDCEILTTIFQMSLLFRLFSCICCRGILWFLLISYTDVNWDDLHGLCLI